MFWGRDRRNQYRYIESIGMGGCQPSKYWNILGLFWFSKYWINIWHILVNPYPEHRTATSAQARSTLPRCLQAAHAAAHHRRSLHPLATTHLHQKRGACRTRATKQSAVLSLRLSETHTLEELVCRHRTGEVVGCRALMRRPDDCRAQRSHQHCLAVDHLALLQPAHRPAPAPPT